MAAIPRTGDFNEHYELVRQVSAGSIGIVFHCKRKDDDKDYAVKTISTERMPLNMIKNEATICQQVEHRHIIEFVDYYANEALDLHHIVFEMAWGGDLYHDVIAHARYSELEAAQCLEQILQGVHYLHRTHIIHLDLKADNILLFNSIHGTVVKIADFGNSMHLGQDQGCTYLGTADTLNFSNAPELTSGEVCTEIVDLWSCGAVLYLMIHGRNPFHSAGENLLDEMLHRAYASLDESDNDTAGEDATNLIEGLLDPDPDTRLTVELALIHPFIQNLLHVRTRFNWYTTMVRVNMSGRPKETPEPSKETEISADEAATALQTAILESSLQTAELQTAILESSQAVSSGASSKENSEKPVNDSDTTMQESSSLPVPGQAVVSDQESLVIDILPASAAVNETSLTVMNVGHSSVNTERPPQLDIDAASVATMMPELQSRSDLKSSASSSSAEHKTQTQSASPAQLKVVGRKSRKRTSVMLSSITSLRRSDFENEGVPRKKSAPVMGLLNRSINPLTDLPRQRQMPVYQEQVEDHEADDTENRQMDDEK